MLFFNFRQCVNIFPLDHISLNLFFFSHLSYISAENIVKSGLVFMLLCFKTVILVLVKNYRRRALC